MSYYKGPDWTQMDTWEEPPRVSSDRCIICDGLILTDSSHVLVLKFEYCSETTHVCWSKICYGCRWYRQRCNSCISSEKQLIKNQDHILKKKCR